MSVKEKALKRKFGRLEGGPMLIEIRCGVWRRV